MISVSYGTLRPTGSPVPYRKRHWRRRNPVHFLNEGILASMTRARPLITLTRDEARGLMLAAQHLYDPPSPTPNLAALQQTVEQLGAVVPQPRRRYGYYCLAILHRGRIVGRLDPRMDRASGALLIQSLHLEPQVEATPLLLEALSASLRELLTFLGGQTVQFGAAVPVALGAALRDRLP
jgi:uncharacterized protein YcaQ